MPAVVYKLSYHYRNHEQAGSILQKRLQHLVMVKFQVILKAEERRKIIFIDIGMAHVKCLLLSVTDLSWGSVWTKRVNHLAFSALPWLWLPKCPHTICRAIAFLVCGVIIAKGGNGAVEMMCVLLLYSLFSSIYIWSSAMYSVCLTLWGAQWHYSPRLEYEGSCPKTHITCGITSTCLEVTINVKCCTSGLKATYLHFS